jgi:tRNA A-37 threonylcarbamoyl transferase component Bud32
MFDSLKLSDLPKKQSYVLRKPSTTRPIIWVVEENGLRAVVKDYSTNKFVFRNTVGRFLVWREGKAYKKLKGLRGVPNIYRVMDGLALAIEQIPGRDLKKVTREMQVPETFLGALKDLVNDLHRRGIAHCDLKKATNILMGKDGLPYIIDWGASISEKEFRFPPLNLIYRRFVLDDHMAVIKLKLRYTPPAVTPAENKRYNNRDKAEKHIRIIRDRLRSILQKLA